MSLRTQRKAETRDVKESSWVLQFEHLDPTIPEGAFSVKSHFCLGYLELCFYHLQLIETPASHAWKGLSESWGQASHSYPTLGLQTGCIREAAQWFQWYRW